MATRAEIDAGRHAVVGFVFNGKIEYSVTVEDGIRLYVMETDQEIVFDNAEGLMSWLRANRAEAALEPEPRASEVQPPQVHPLGMTPRAPPFDSDAMGSRSCSDG